MTADWLRELTTDEVEAAQRARIRREVTGLRRAGDQLGRDQRGRHHAGVRQRGAPTASPGCAGSAAGSPRCGWPSRRPARRTRRRRCSSTTSTCPPRTSASIEGVLEAGIQVDAIGLQSHMHQGYWGEERTLEVLDRFARFGLPLHMTETTLLSGDLMPPEIVDLNDYQPETWPSTPEGEERQAEEMVRHYRTLLSHPAGGARRRTGASPTTAPGSAPRSAWSAPTAPRSRPTTRCATWCAASGGSPRRRCAPTTTAWSRSRAGSATTASRRSAARRRSPWPRPGRPSVDVTL